MSLKRKDIIISLSILMMTLLVALPIYFFYKERANNYYDLMGDAFVEGSLADYLIYSEQFTKAITFQLFSMLFPFILFFPILQITSGLIYKNQRLLKISSVFLFSGIITILGIVYAYLRWDIRHEILYIVTWVYFFFYLGFSKALKLDLKDDTAL